MWTWHGNIEDELNESVHAYQTNKSNLCAERERKIIEKSCWHTERTKAIMIRSHLKHSAVFNAFIYALGPGVLGNYVIKRNFSAKRVGKEMPDQFQR